MEDIWYLVQTVEKHISQYLTHIYAAPEILKNSNFPNSSSTSILVSNWK